MEVEAKGISCGKFRFCNTLCVIAMIIAGCFVTGCSHDEFSETNEIDVISQSKEYEEYIVAHLNFYNELQNIDGQKVKIGEINGKNVYRITTNELNIELFDKIFITHNKLIDKYPEYEKLETGEKSKLFEIVSVKSKKIARLIPVENTPIRLKNATVEQLTRFIQRYFSYYLDAFVECFNYSNTNKVESGGVITPEGSALFIIDTAATINSMTMRVHHTKSGSIYNATFHFHPGGNTAPSRNDSIAMQAMEKLGINTLIILTPDSTNSLGFKTSSYSF
jgi:proteasome lid subunit RPN8/RPN11